MSRYSATVAHVDSASRSTSSAAVRRPAGTRSEVVDLVNVRERSLLRDEDGLQRLLGRLLREVTSPAERKSASRREPFCRFDVRLGVR
jgi:hypothetical protein